VYVRWGYEKVPPAYAYSGWNIDDIEIWGKEIELHDMNVMPLEGVDAHGAWGGQISPEAAVYGLTNHAGMPITFTADSAADWIDLSPQSGVVPVDGKVDVLVTFNDVAHALPVGLYEAEIAFTNLTTHDGDCTRAVTLDITGPSPVYRVEMNENPGWSMSGEWAFGQPTGQGGDQWGFPDPTSGATGSNVCGVNLNGDYSTTPGGPYHLTTTPFDCEGLEQIELRFQRWLNTDYQDYVYATIEASNDGLNWQMIWQNVNVGEIIDNEWLEHVYDISSVADDQATVYLRWGYLVNKDAYPYSGWNIDDVEIWGAQIVNPCPGDVNGDATVDVDDLFEIIQHWGSNGGPCDVNDDGVVDVNDLFVVLNGWGPCP
jgi:hypothetical protein